MDKRLSRRQFLKVFTTLSISAFVLALKRLLGNKTGSGIAQSGNERVNLPIVSQDQKQPPTPTQTATLKETATSTATPNGTARPSETATPTETATATPTQTGTPGPPIGPKVIHVHSENASNWDGADFMYWEYVNQDVVDTMVDQGLMALTDTASIMEAWLTLIPNYQPGQAIAIKVNLNHSTGCSEIDADIIALIHPVNAVIRGLKSIGVNEPDIWVFDAIRRVPDHFAASCPYNNIKFYDLGCYYTAGFTSDDPNAYVSFSPPAGIPQPSPVKLTDVIIDATYLINMPILRVHAGVGITLSFKNHFGTIDYPSHLHDYIGPDSQYFRPDYSPFIDLYMNPHILNKTILTIGDGVIGAKQWKIPSPSWETFGGNVPNSLFFSTDPVAIDCVMLDILNAEVPIDERATYYLPFASSSGLGVYERGDPWGSGYNLIAYQKIEL